MPDDLLPRQPWALAALGVVGGVLAKWLGQHAWRLINWRSSKRQTAAEADKVEADVAASWSAVLTSREREHDEQIGRLREDVNKLWAEMGIVRAERAECEERSAKQQIELARQAAAMVEQEASLKVVQTKADWLEVQYLALLEKARERGYSDLTAVLALAGGGAYAAVALTLAAMLGT